ncbi:replicative DNA helicase [Deinococcus arenae]|uniref:Replicative DNA helicase n=2 Tax=Deinococcus TaxID=1298 RepID=A0A8H9GRX8_9DEIO|nr:MULTISPECIES: replicative DNA helicase [Deinococcus]ALW87839.1 hypothetical protein AUC44_02130 [Deinococcus actinosclerus]AWT34471.1 replicative DNA helicase [Deinococcus actinosclerus]GGM54151.1 replicative DNA helicase [Deinococcus arenae]
MTDSAPRVAPHNIEAETALLGSVLLDNDTLTNAAVGHLTPAAFYQRRHQLIWAALPALREARTDAGQPGPIDLITLSEELTRRGQLDEAGGLTYLMGLGDQVPTAAYAEHYARIVQEKAILRAKISAAGKVMQACFDQQLPLEEIDALTSLIPTLTRADAGLESIGGAVEAVLHQAEHGTGPNGAPTGLKDLDDLMGGLEPGRLYVLAARPAMGKTALAFQMAMHVAQKRGRVLGFSLEMPTEEIGARLLCSEARVDLARFSDSRRGNRTALNGRDWERLTSAGNRLHQLPMEMLAKPGLRLQELLDTVRRAHAAQPLSLFVLDYLQLVQVSGRAGENAVQRVTMISTALKSLAMELGIPVLALSQLSRAVEQRPNHRPMLSDLRESGAVEQDADVVMFIYRDEYYNKDTDQHGVAEVILGKQRNGPTGTVKLQFHSAFTRFNDLALH